MGLTQSLSLSSLDNICYATLFALLLKSPSVHPYLSSDLVKKLSFVLYTTPKLFVDYIPCGNLSYLVIIFKPSIYMVTFLEFVIDGLTYVLV